MAKFRKKPVVIEAVQFNGENQEMIATEFVAGQTSIGTSPTEIEIYTLEGVMKAMVGDWIIKVKGEFYPCKPDIFEKSYEPVD